MDRHASRVQADRELLERIRRDDAGAFERFVELYGDRIFGFGMRVCGEPEDARDVAQDTLLQAFRSLRDLEHPEALRSWLYRVVSNACLMKRRRGRHDPGRELSLEQLMPRGAEDLGTEIPDASSLPDDEAERAELRRTVRAAIDRLPDDARVVLLLRDMEQLSTAETARALDVPESTVKMRLHRARLALRKELRGIFREGGPPAGGRP